MKGTLDNVNLQKSIFSYIIINNPLYRVILEDLETIRIHTEVNRFLCKQNLYSIEEHAH